MLSGLFVDYLVYCSIDHKHDLVLGQKVNFGDEEVVLLNLN